MIFKVFSYRFKGIFLGFSMVVLQIVCFFSRVFQGCLIWRSLRVLLEGPVVALGILGFA